MSGHIHEALADHLPVNRTSQQSHNYAISLNHVIDWDQAKVIDRESNGVDRSIKKAIHIRKEQDKSMNRNEGSQNIVRAPNIGLSSI